MKKYVSASKEEQIEKLKEFRDLDRSKCPFCIEDNLYLDNLLFDDYSLEDLTIYRTPNFFVLPDIAPLVEGHLLIISLNSGNSPFGII